VTGRAQTTTQLHGRIVALSFLLDQQTARAADAEAARMREASGDPLEPVYRWLVNVLGFPVDITVTERPAWLDLRRLAALWLERERGTGHGGDDVTVDDYVFMLLEETGWDEAKGSPS